MYGNTKKMDASILVLLSAMIMLNVHVDRLVDLVQCLRRVISYFGVDLTEVGTGYWILGNRGGVFFRNRGHRPLVISR